MWPSLKFRLYEFRRPASPEWLKVSEGVAHSGGTMSIRGDRVLEGKRTILRLGDDEAAILKAVDASPQDERAIARAVGLPIRRVRECLRRFLVRAIVFRDGGRYLGAVP
jgi:hypothetical protein